MAYLALLCPMIAFEVEDFVDHFKGKAYGRCPVFLIVFMCIVELTGLCIYHLQMAGKGYGDRFKGYFINREYVYSDYDEVCGMINESGIKKVGLMIGGDSYEYPIWQKLGDVTIKHVMVTNESACYEDKSYLPDCIIATDSNDDTIVYNETEYYLQDECDDNGQLWLYRR